MTPQERDLLTNLVGRLRQAPDQDIDREAEAMINDLVRDKPDTPYVLAQTVLIQDYALHQAQDRIADLEHQLQGNPPKKSGGFLSALFGGGDPPPQRAPQYQQQTYQAPPQPAYQPQPAYAQPGPWGGAPAQPSFLRSAATTAAGIAGGALLFQGIESLFHPGFGYGGGFGPGIGGMGYGGGLMPQPGITETVVNNYYDNTDNNYYGNSDGGAGHDVSPHHDSGFDSGSSDPGVTDVGFDDSSDFSGGGDFGGGGDDFV
jgi:hypothetical protein